MWKLITVYSLDIVRYIGFSYNEVTKSCGIFEKHDASSSGAEANTKIYIVESLDCLKNDHCQGKLPYCKDMKCSACDGDLNPDTGLCFKHFPEKKSFTDARASCQSLNKGDLAVISDKATQDIASSLTSAKVWVAECGGSVDHDADYGGGDIQIVPNVQSWRDCADLCFNQDQCTIWTWIGPDSTNLGRRFECIPKTGSRPSSPTSNKGLISGAKCKKTVSAVPGENNYLHNINWKSGHMSRYQFQNPQINLA